MSARTTAPLPRPLTHHWTGEPSVPRKATQSRRAILPGEAGGARVSLKSEPWVSLGAGQRQGAGLETGLQRSGVLWGHVGSSDPRLPSQRPGAPRETAQRERPRPRRREHRTI